jgi:predicted PurR-regulated permease PerM
MNKKGLTGKIFAILGILLLIVLIVVGITAYQAYSLIKLVQEQIPSISEDISSMGKGDCTKFQDFKTRMNIIITESKSACKNPLINRISDRLSNLPLNCTAIKISSIEDYDILNKVCLNKTNFINQTINSS